MAPAEPTPAHAVAARLAGGPTALRDAVVRRVRLTTLPAPHGADGPPLGLLLGEVSAMAENLRRPFTPDWVPPPARHPRAVMLLPGFGTHPVRMRRMAQKLEQAGHVARRWGLGFNLGPTEDIFDLLERRVQAISADTGTRVTLVGWSLGGLFARELAKRQPQVIERVITMGSPFSGTPYANNVWRIYHLVTGHRVDMPPVQVRLAEKPPVDTVALWSPRDGIVSPRCAAGRAGERDRAVALRCSHLGFANAREAIAAVLEELDRPVQPD